MKRITLFAGHYGSGKTNVAINYAKWLRRSCGEVAMADLDIVNPYFRTKDSADELRKAGVELVVSGYANSNVDFPAMPKEAYALFAGGGKVVVDVGGDDRGALALGRYVGDIRNENDYEMLAVVNFSRPLTSTPAEAMAVLKEIEEACSLPFTGIVNNTNLGMSTTADDVVESARIAGDLSRMMGLPVRFTSVAAHLAERVAESLPDVFALDIQKLYYQLP